MAATWRRECPRDNFKKKLRITLLPEPELNKGAILVGEDQMVYLTMCCTKS